MVQVITCPIGRHSVTGANSELMTVISQGKNEVCLVKLKPKQFLAQKSFPKGRLKNDDHFVQPWTNLDVIRCRVADDNLPVADHEHQYI